MASDSEREEGELEEGEIPVNASKADSEEEVSAIPGCCRRNVIPLLLTAQQVRPLHQAPVPPPLKLLASILPSGPGLSAAIAGSHSQPCHRAR